MASEGTRSVARNLRTLYDSGTTAGLTDGQLLERFATRRGEAAELAFAALVERHGPMILRTCRGLLRHEDDALDAFQATFLILARRGGSLWVRDSLGPWLHRVASRVAVHALRVASRRRAAERKAAEGRPERSAGVVHRDDLERVLHQELDRLPDRYRIPILLCDLDGRTHDEAARHLRCPVGTVKSRLARGREQLRGRLARRGIAPTIGALGTLLSADSTSAEMPKGVLESAARAACQVAGGEKAAAGAVSARATSLADGTWRSLMLAKLKRTTACLLATAIIGAGAGRVVGWPSTGQTNRDDQTPGADKAADAAPSQGNAPVVTQAEKRDLPDFDEIHVIGHIRALITPGPDRRVAVIGDGGPSSEVQLRMIQIPGSGRRILEVTGPLDVHEGESKDAGKVPDGLAVEIITPRMNKVSAGPHASVEIRDIRDEALTLTVTDGARLQAAGTCNSLAARVGGSGVLDASGLKVEEATVTATGRSTTVVHASKSLSVVSQGDARVEYVGTPGRLNTITSDASQLIQRP